MTKKYIIEWGTNTPAGEILTRNSKRFESYNAAKAALVQKLFFWQMDFWTEEAPKVDNERDAWNEMIDTHYFHFYESNGTDCVEIGLSESELLYWHWVDYDSANFKKHG